MSHPSLHDDDSGPMLRSRTKKNFEISPSVQSTAPPTPTTEPQSFLSPGGSTNDEGTTPSRTRSILNLTSSTLFGIYQPTDYATDREEASTPWGTGAETPTGGPNGFAALSRKNMPASAFQNGPKGGLHKRRRSTMPSAHSMPRRGFKGVFLPMVGRMTAMFGVGVLYGLLITHLHDRQGIAPVKVENINRSGWTYMLIWGTTGAFLGEALPWLDGFWAPNEDENAIETESDQNQNKGKRGLGGWNDIVRSIGAFVGIAFAIRKLPWQSTLQLSLTLALANPAVWYTVDRSPPGFVLSTLVALGGTIVLLGINPTLMPSMESTLGRNGTGLLKDELVFGMFSQESVGVVTWIASVLFVSSVCFGNIGRRLAPQKQ